MLKKSIDNTIKIQEELNKKVDKKNKRIRSEMSSLSYKMKKIKKHLNPNNKKQSKNKLEPIFKDFKDNAFKNHNNQLDELKKKGNFKKAHELGKKTAENLKTTSKQLDKLIKQLSGEDKREAIKLLKKFSNETRELSKRYSKSLKSIYKEQEKSVNGGQISQELKDKLIKELQQTKSFLKNRKHQIDDKFEGIIRGKNKIIKDIDAVNKEIDKLNEQMSSNALYYIEGAEKIGLQKINKLALNIMKTQIQLEEEMKNRCNKCNNPSMSNMPNLDDIAEMQKQINKEIQEMLEKLKSGKITKEELMKMSRKPCSKQGGLGDKIKEISEEAEKQGSSKMGDLKNLEKDMRDAEKNIKLKKIDNKLVQQQKEILEKLLKYSKGISGKQKDKKRKAEKNIEKNRLLDNQNLLRKQLIDFLNRQNFRKRY